jgi:hypothetical protein
MPSSIGLCHDRDSKSYRSPRGAKCSSSRSSPRAHLHNLCKWAKGEAAPTSAGQKSSIAWAYIEHRLGRGPTKTRTRSVCDIRWAPTRSYVTGASSSSSRTISLKPAALIARATFSWMITSLFDSAKRNRSRPSALSGSITNL